MHGDHKSDRDLMRCECLYVVVQRFSQLRTQTERITQLHGRQLQQHEKRLRLCALTAFDETLPHLTILPHLPTANSQPMCNATVKVLKILTNAAKHTDIDRKSRISWNHTFFTDDC